MGLFSGWTHSWTKRPKLGWFRFNIVGSGLKARLSSVTLEPFEWLKANSRTRRVTIDLPGPGGISKRFKKQQGRKRW